MSIWDSAFGKIHQNSEACENTHQYTQQSHQEIMITQLQIAFGQVLTLL
jgi:hypothetical protein